MVDGGDGIQSQAFSGHGRRCVIWVPPENAPPSRLLIALSRRHVPTTVLADAPSVMFDLSLSEAGAGGAGLAGVLALIVVEPAGQPHLKELLTAVRTYYPQLPVWQYRSGPTAAGGGLARLTGADGEPMPRDESADIARNGDAPPLRAEPDAADRVTASATDADEDDDADDRRALRLLNDEPHEPMLTTEELEMLLGPMPHEEPPRT